MKSLTFNQLKKFVLEAAKDAGYSTKDVTMVNTDDEKALNEALEKLEQAGAAAEGIAKVRAAIKEINVDNVKRRALAKAKASIARTEEGQTKGLDDAAKAFAELDNTDNANYFFSVADKASETGDRIGVFLRKTKNPMGGPAAVSYVLKVIENEKFRKAHEDLCIFAEAMMAQANVIFKRMEEAGVILPPEEKWTAELRMLQGGSDKITQYKMKADAEIAEGLGDWARKAWDWTVNTIGDFADWLANAAKRLVSANRRADRAAGEFEDSLDDLNAALDKAENAEDDEDVDEPEYDTAVLQESRRQALRRRRMAAIRRRR